MLSKITLKNFKSAERLEMPVAHLTILTGLNGSGKSSVLQALALVKQSYDFDASGTQLILDGTALSIGFGGDVLYEAAESDELGIALRTSLGDFSWNGEVEAECDTINTTFCGDTSDLKHFFEGFQYIQANRIVPDNQYKQASSRLREQRNLGSRGEFTVDFLSRNTEFKVAKKRNYPFSRLKDNDEATRMREIAPTDYLPDVISAWLQLISPGARAIAKPVDLAVSASLKFEYKGFSNLNRLLDSREHRPSNVGFGLTYSLPIIVACLSAKPGSVLLLENPEAHLHPRGQSALGLLLALCASDGVQIIVETHSDHLLNGIRLAAKQKHILAKNVATHFFTRDVSTGTSRFATPILLDNGRYDDWPDGFFDEWGNALDELLDMNNTEDS